jgi:hypothetical protein
MGKFEIDFLEKYDDQSILEELRRITRATGKQNVTKEDLKKFGRVSSSTVVRRFGSLRKALEKIGLKAERFTKPNKEELLNVLIELWEKTLEKEGRRPYVTDLKAYGYPVSHETIQRYFGSWKKALLAAYDSVTSGISEEISNPPTAPQNSEKSVIQKTRQTLSLRKRFFVLKRDQFTCQNCGRSGVGVRLEVDHFVPVAKGGSDSLDNLHTLCFECNQGKKDSYQ